MKIMILVGIPASGKSTWAKDFVNQNPNWIRVSRDDYRLMLKNQQICDSKIESLINVILNQTITTSLVLGYNVIIDNTNVRKKYINQFIEEFEHLANIEFKIFDIPLEKAIERDNHRQFKVGEDVIKRMFDSYMNLIKTFNFLPIQKKEF
jgi:predicted kinase